MAVIQGFSLPSFPGFLPSPCGQGTSSSQGEEWGQKRGLRGGCLCKINMPSLCFQEQFATALRAHRCLTYKKEEPGLLCEPFEKKLIPRKLLLKPWHQKDLHALCIPSRMDEHKHDCFSGLVFLSRGGLPLSPKSGDTHSHPRWWLTVPTVCLCCSSAVSSELVPCLCGDFLTPQQPCLCLSAPLPLAHRQFP